MYLVKYFALANWAATREAVTDKCTSDAFLFSSLLATFFLLSLSDRPTVLFFHPSSVCLQPHLVVERGAGTQVHASSCVPFKLISYSAALKFYADP